MDELARGIETGIEGRFGFSARVVVSRLLQAFTRLTGDAATTRNWSTVLKLHAAAPA